MRPIGRIDSVLAEVRAIWVNQPDLRLTQMLWNVRDTAHMSIHSTVSKFYNIEEPDLVERLRAQYGCKHVNNEYLGMSKYGQTYRCLICKEITYG